MNSSVVDIGVYKTPYSFGKHREKFKNFITRDGKKIVSQGFNLNEINLECKLNKYIIQNLFGVKITGLQQSSNRLSGPIRNHLNTIFRLLDGGKSLQTSIIETIKGKN